MTATTTHRRPRSRIVTAVGLLLALLASLLALPGTAHADGHPPVLDATAVGAFCDRAPTTSTFSDVGADDPALRAIVCQSDAQVAIAQGHPDGTYRPRADITRRQMALFLVRLADRAQALEMREVQRLAPYSGANRFGDLAGEQAEVIAAVNRLADAGIVAGTGPGTYSPGANVTRRQMATFVVRTLEFLAGEPMHDAGGVDFADTRQESAESRRAIDRAVTHGIFEGNPDGTFGPGTTLTRRQMATVMTRTLQWLYQEWRIGSPFPGDYGEVILERWTSGGPVGGSHTVAATFLDADGAPRAGVTVVFGARRWSEAEQGWLADEEPVVEVRRTTDASGRASYTYSGPAQPAIDEHYAVLEAPHYGPRVPSAWGLHVWTTPAAAGSYEAYVLGRTGDEVHAEAFEDADPDTSVFRSFTLGDADTYRIDGAATTKADWVAALDAELDEVGWAEVDVVHGGAGTSTFDLIPDQ